MDEDAVLREIATRQESRAALPLHLLGQRFGVLAGTPAFDAERIPLGPRAMCRAMRDASQTLQVAYEARLLLYRIFDRQVMANYALILEKLDEAMDADGVLPGLTFVPVRLRATPQNEPESKAESSHRGAAAHARGADASQGAAQSASVIAAHAGDATSAYGVDGRKLGRSRTTATKPHRSPCCSN